VERDNGGNAHAFPVTRADRVANGDPHGDAYADPDTHTNAYDHTDGVTDGLPDRNAYADTDPHDHADSKSHCDAVAVLPHHTAVRPAREPRHVSVSVPDGGFP
jgi:hypothetical protein